MNSITTNPLPMKPGISADVPKPHGQTAPQNRPKARKPGRCTPQLMENALALCTHLTTDKAICGALNVQPTLWCEWKRRAKDGQEPWKAMFEKIDQARAIKVVQLASSISQDSDWRAKVWLLERLSPEFSTRLCRNCGQSSERAHLARGAASSEVAVRIEILPDQNQ